MPLKVAVLCESVEGERRVALDPSVVGRLVKQGCTVALQSQAGASAGFPDAAYSAAEVVATREQAIEDADIVVKVLPPTVMRWHC